MAEDIYERIVYLRSRGIRAALATIIARNGATPRKEAAKMLIVETGELLGTIGGGAVEAEVVRRAREIIRTGNPEILEFDLSGKSPEENALVCGGRMSVYLEPVIPEQTLYIFGAGHVGKALAEMARFIGFSTVIIDDREELANIERFPHAKAFYIDRWDDVLKKIEVSETSYLFISTREHSIDEKCLRFALHSSARYIGMLGSRKKILLLKEFLEKEGFGADAFERLIVPVGFDIGAETPEEIAVSIAAELIAARKSRDVFSLRDAVRSAGCLV